LSPSAGGRGEDQLRNGEGYEARRLFLDHREIHVLYDVAMAVSAVAAAIAIAACSTTVKWR
jgi:hypothetical protein